MKITATTHSLDGIIGRLGVDPLEVNRFLETWLLTSRVVTYEQAVDIVSVFSKNRNDTYYLAPDPVTGKDVVIIVRDCKIVTIMTQLTNELYGVEGFFQGGVRVIRTMEGNTVEDTTGWVRHLRRIRKTKCKKSK